MFLLVAIILPLIVPFTIALILGFTRLKTRLEWFISSWFTLAFALYNYLTGSWFLLSVYLKYLLLAAVAAAILIAYLRMPKDAPAATFKAPGYRNTMTFYFVPTLTLSLFVLVAFQGKFYSGQTVSLAFPLKDGSYTVSQGGKNSMLNSHLPNSGQAYSVDIVKLNSIGARAETVFPTTLGQTAIFNTPVYSPCDGKVIAAVDNLPDLTPGTKLDIKNLIGNHVVISCQNTDLLLSGIKNGSLTVKKDEIVKSGDSLAVVGSSYENTEPHLHIQASQGGTAGQFTTGTAVGMLFDGRFLTRNDIISK